MFRGYIDVTAQCTLLTTQSTALSAIGLSLGTIHRISRTPDRPVSGTSLHHVPRMSRLCLPRPLLSPPPLPWSRPPAISRAACTLGPSVPCAARATAPSVCAEVADYCAFRSIESPGNSPFPRTDPAVRAPARPLPSIFALAHSSRIHPARRTSIYRDIVVGVPCTESAGRGRHGSTAMAEKPSSGAPVSQQLTLHPIEAHHIQLH